MLPNNIFVQVLIKVLRLISSIENVFFTNFIDSLIRNEIAPPSGAILKGPSNNYYGNDMGINNLESGIKTSDLRPKIPFAPPQAKQTYRKSPKRQLSDMADTVYNENEDPDEVISDEDLYDDLSDSDEMVKSDNSKYISEDKANRGSHRIFDNRLGQRLNNERNNIKYNNYKLNLLQAVQVPEYQTMGLNRKSRIRSFNTPKNDYQNEVSLLLSAEDNC